VFQFILWRSCRGCGLGELVDSRCVDFLREIIVEVRPRQASEIVCVVLAGTSEGLAGLRVLEGPHCKCCSTK